MIVKFDETTAYRVEDVMMVSLSESDTRTIQFMFKGGQIVNFRTKSPENARNEVLRTIQFMTQADDMAYESGAAKHKNAYIERLKDVLNTLMIDTEDKAEIIKLMEE